MEGGRPAAREERQAWRAAHTRREQCAREGAALRERLAQRPGESGVEGCAGGETSVEGGEYRERAAQRAAQRDVMH